MPKLLQQKKYQIIVVVLLTILSYSNIFQNKLVLDDNSFIKDWEQIRQLSNLPDLLIGNVPPIHQGVYRPVRSVLYLLYYQIFSTNPFGYHLHSILVHLISTILVFFIVKTLSYDLKFKNPVLTYLPFLTSLLFGLHPIHTEAITYIAASMEMTGVVFFLASFYFYTKARRIISLIFALLAFFTYEMTVTLPLFLSLYEILVLKTPLTKLKKRGKWILVFFGLVALFFIVRIFILKIPLARGEYLGYSFYSTQLVMLKVYLIYIWRLIFPLNLSYITVLALGFESFTTHYSNLQSILSLSLLTPAIFLSLAALIVLGFVIVYFWKRLPLVSFALVWFFISLLPVAYFFPQGIAISEKYTYIGSIGYCLLASYLLCKFQNKKLLKIFSLVIACFLILGYSILTYQRNRDWRSPITFWNKVAKQLPQSSLAQYNLGIYYLQEGDSDSATASYRRAIENEPLFWEARFNLANILINSGQASEAAKLYQSVILLNPTFTKAQENLSLSLQQIKDANTEKTK